MNCEHLKTEGTWRDVADCANTTISKDAGTKEPSSSWKKRMLLSEHSPIRRLSLEFIWRNLKYWVSVHIVRHKVGIEHWVSTQRTDRTGVSRDESLQSAEVTHKVLTNPQSLITISRKRLCRNASPETQEAWAELLGTIKDSQPELYSVCVPDCVYRGHCYEYKTCGFSQTKRYAQILEEYRKI